MADNSGLRHRRVSGAQRASFERTTGETLREPLIDHGGGWAASERETGESDTYGGSGGGGGGDCYYSHQGEAVRGGRVYSTDRELSLGERTATLAEMIGGILAELARHVTRAVRAIGVRAGAVDGGQGATMALAPFKDTLRASFVEERDAPLLHAMWSSVFPGRPFERRGEHWGLLGFQGVDPATDLRSAGRLSAAVISVICLMDAGDPAAAESEPYRLGMDSYVGESAEMSGLNFALTVMALEHLVLDLAGIAIAVPRTGGTVAFREALASAMPRDVTREITWVPGIGAPDSALPPGYVPPMPTTAAVKQSGDAVPTGHLIDFDEPDGTDGPAGQGGREETPVVAAVTLTAGEVAFARVVCSALRPVRSAWLAAEGQNVMDFPPVLAEVRARIEVAVAKHEPRGMDALCSTIARA